MQSVPRDLEDLVGRIAHAAEAMYPDLTVTWLPDAAGEQFVFMLCRAGGSGEIQTRLGPNVPRYTVEIEPDVARSA